jgi:hypothetical protein
MAIGAGVATNGSPDQVGIEPFGHHSPECIMSLMVLTAHDQLGNTSSLPDRRTRPPQIRSSVVPVSRK